MSLGVVANVYNEAFALPGWLEMACSFFDDVRIYHSGPRGKCSDDGTIELLEHWRIPYSVGNMDEGFGVVRTKAIRSSPCEYVMLMDADERFWPMDPVFRCIGESRPLPVAEQVLQEYDTPTPGATPWNWENAKNIPVHLRVEKAVCPANQGAKLRSIVDLHPDAIVLSRRHWIDFQFHPSQNWHTDPDVQTKIVRNDPSIYWQSKMHETLIGAKDVRHNFDLFVEHFHIPFKSMNPKQRAIDIETYRRIWRS